MYVGCVRGGERAPRAPAHSCILGVEHAARVERYAARGEGAHAACHRPTGAAARHDQQPALGGAGSSSMFMCSVELKDVRLLAGSLVRSADGRYGVSCPHRDGATPPMAASGRRLGASGRHSPFEIKCSLHRWRECPLLGPICTRGGFGRLRHSVMILRPGRASMPARRAGGYSMLNLKLLSIRAIRQQWHAVHIRNACLVLALFAAFRKEGGVRFARDARTSHVVCARLSHVGRAPEPRRGRASEMVHVMRCNMLNGSGKVCTIWIVHRRWSRRRRVRVQDRQPRVCRPYGRVWHRLGALLRLLIRESQSRHHRGGQYRMNDQDARQAVAVDVPIPRGEDA